MRSRVMARCHLNVFDDATAADDEGFELLDIEAAREEAIRGARALIAEQLQKDGRINLLHRIEVEDDMGTSS